MRLTDRRFVVLGGKGGVGRTTVAAVLARVAAGRDKRVLVAQTDARERLGKLLGRPGPIGPAIVEAAERIWAVNMTPRDALHEYGMMRLRFESLYRAVFENKAVRGFLGAVPGLDSYAMFGKAFFHTTETAKGGLPRFDLVILDGPASGHAAAMLRIPQAILDAVPRGPLTGDARAARDLLSDPARAALCIVTLAEDLPVRETADLARTARDDLRMPLGPVIVNALPSDRLADPDVAALLDAVDAPTGDAPLDATLSAAEGLRAHWATAVAMLERLRRDPGLPLCTLPRLPTADLGADEIARLASILDAAI